MKNLVTYQARPVVVQQNTTKKAANFGVIKDANTGEVLHRGQIGYITKVAEKKYNVKPIFTL